MSFGDFIWVFIIIFSLLPWYRQRMLQANRYRTLRTLEQKRGSRVITLIHRQESISLLGIPLVQSMIRNISCAPSVSRTMSRSISSSTPKLVLAAEQFLARATSGQVTVFAALRHVRGTLLALSADEIVMDENAVLGRWTADRVLSGRFHPAGHGARTRMVKDGP